MIIVNGRQLELGEALNNKSHPLYTYARSYDDGIRELRERYGKKIRFYRPGFPKLNKGSDSKGNEAVLKEPTPPALFPLQTYYSNPVRGRELWGCCLGIPELLPNNLWGIGERRSLYVEEHLDVDIETEPDLAYYLFYISNAKKSRRLKIDDKAEELRIRAEKERVSIERKAAIWTMLSDEDQLRKMAQAYGVNNAHKKDPNAIRFELETILVENDKNKRKDISIKGTREFLEEMKVTDNIRLRAFIRRIMDDGKLIYKPDGRYRVGEKILLQLPATELKNGFNYLCNFYHSPNNADRLKELLIDTVDKEYLDSIKDDKDFAWLSKVMGVTTAFKKKEETRSLVYGAFNIAL